MGIYRRGLNCVLELLLKEADEEVVASLWRLFLMYDGLILGPFRKGAQLVSVIKERVGLFLAGDWDPLFNGHLQFRDPSAHRQPSDVPFLRNPLDAKAQRAQLHVLNNQSLGSAASALRANPFPAPLAAGDVTASFRKLNPQAGGDVPRPSEAHSVCGPKTEAEQLKSTEWQRSVGLEPGDPTASTWKRRPLQPPPEELPDPVSFSLEEVLRRVRRTNKSSAGGLSGSNYKTMQAWFYQSDSLAENLTTLFNRIAAGRVPASIIPLLTAGRGLAIPKPSGIGLRPVVVGNIILRFVGSLALVQKSAEITKYFLEPRPLQSAVGLAGGCELMGAAIDALLSEHVGWVYVAADAKNAFSSFCRSQMWGPLIENFPDLAALGRLMYGNASSIIFNESGYGRSEVLNSVGCARVFVGQLPLLPHHPSPTEATCRRVPWLRHPSTRRRCPYHCPPRASSGGRMKGGVSSMLPYPKEN